jgi:hypothetical protein
MSLKNVPSSKKRYEYKKTQYFLNGDFEPVKIIAKNYPRKILAKKTLQTVLKDENIAYFNKPV